MVRWGYIVLEPDPAETRPKPPRSRWIIRATPKGRLAQEIWRPLFGVVEKRWEERFGKDHIDQLREALLALILGYGLFSKGPDRPRQAPSGNDDLPLPSLLSRVLLAFAIEFERESVLSLAICANLLRVLKETGVPRSLASLRRVARGSGRLPPPARHRRTALAGT